jgi:glycosyltransferase involved in cell wall biosynthesis
VKPSTFDRVYGNLPDGDRARIHLLGPVSDDVKQDLLAATDLFAMPSRVDSFGIVYLEAWAYGVAVIGCRAGGVPDVISDGRDGLLVEFGDEASLAAAIESLLDDAELRQAMGQRGRAKVKARYTWDRIYEGLESVYNGLLETQSASGSQPCTS